jgi:LPXTG-motif cell wall-anchored protein
VAQVRPAAQARPAALPFTGSDTDTLLTTAIGLLMLGCAFVAAGRRRKTVSIG